ncbi:MAG: terminase small subunit [Planctomycetota bacterium]|nr:terminase small subunit [Planctomycetota bacterium]
MARGQGLERRLRFARALFAGRGQLEAAREAGYKDGPNLKTIASRMAKHADVLEELERLRGPERAAAVAERDEVLGKLTEQLRGGWAEYLTFTEVDDGAGGKRLVWTGIDLARLRADGKAHLIEGLEVTDKGTVKFKVASSQGASDRLSKLLGWNAPEKHEVDHKGRPVEGMSEAELEAELRKFKRAE